VNLAAPLADGQQVVVPRRGPPGSAPPGAPATGVKVSLAMATVEQLDELPGIGPVTAQKIVDWRATHGPFRSVEDLDAIPGIGPARVEQLRDLVTP
jgi:competence protein ComEA